MHYVLYKIAYYMYIHLRQYQDMPLPLRHAVDEILTTIFLGTIINLPISI